ncbi:zinc-finger homeodomain protein 3-like [Populus nigra]|uniref:zinc-finger homeodomain protein 3-like n=1 Tax=Populus nigra TaxID=3691 RepID=UPI002B26ADB8|nr:zinc-finger homeodomain protein 3-like [Populus nigra]
MANADSKSRPLNEESRTITEYRECWLNHAMLTGGSAIDGCGEFTPKGDQGTKEAFICEACGCHRNFHRKQLIKNGIIILDTHLSPPPCRLYGASMWVEKNASGFHPLSSSLPLTSPPPPCYLRTSVSDQESLVHVPPPPPSPPRKSEKKTKARKGPKRGTLMHNRK